MKRIEITLFMIVLSVSSSAWGGEIGTIKDNVFRDYKNFYSIKNFEKLAIGIGIAAPIANTTADREIQHWYQDSIRSDATDDFSRVVRQLGDGKIVIPAYLGVAILGRLSEKTKVGSIGYQWGQRTLRAFLVGAPTLLFFQNFLGASRPCEGMDSHWHPFEDNNAVSGHSFMGAVPFITAAKMMDNMYLKSGLYLASVLCGLSRINDNKHFFSQVALGWWLGYLAVEGVNKTEGAREVAIGPLLIPKGIGMQIGLSF